MRWLGVWLLLGCATTGQSQTVPLPPVHHSGHLPLIYEITADLQTKKNAVFDAKSAQSLLEELKANQKKLYQEKGNEKAQYDLHLTILDMALRLENFAEKSLSGEVPQENQDRELANPLPFRLLITRYSASLKNLVAKNEKQLAAQKKIKPKKGVKPKKIPRLPPMPERVRFSALRAEFFRNRTSGLRSIAQETKNIRRGEYQHKLAILQFSQDKKPDFPAASKEEQAYRSLMKARKEAGLNLNMKSRQRSRKSYAALLAAGLRAAAGLNPTLKTDSLKFGLLVWIKAEGKNFSYEKPPADFKGWGGLPDLFLQFAESDSTRGKQWREAAIAAQTAQAKWEVSPPWKGFAAARAEERNKLLEMLRKYQSDSWTRAAHEGLLLTSAGQINEAFQLWQKKLEKEPSNNTHARHAAGYMITAYQKAKSWDELQQWIDFCRSKNIAPLHREKPLPLTPWLVQALFEGGKKNLEENKFLDAEKRFTRLTTDFSRTPEAEDSYLYLAQAKYGAQKYREAVETLFAALKVYPHHRRLPQLLKLGSQWCEALAYEEASLFFLEQRMEKDSKSPYMKNVMDRLASLYLGKESFSDLRRVNLKRMKSPVYSNEERERIASETFLLALDVADDGENAKMAQMFVKDPRPNIRALALLSLARKAFSGKSQRDLKVYDEQISRMGAAEGSLVVEAVSEIRYLRGLLQFDLFPTEDVDNLSLKHPTATLQKMYDGYASAKQLILTACQTETASFCSGAHFKAARSASIVADKISEVTINETLDDATVKQFQNTKQSLLNRLIQDEESSDEKAFALVRSGIGTPEFIGEILWHNTADWDFDKVIGEVGQGYVQF